MTTGSTSGRDTRQYLVFELGTERYAVDILGVREIRVWEQATRLPNTPPYVQGVINLRGEIVPIVDLCQRFLGVATDCGPRTVVVVLQARQGARDRVVGVVVDAVSDVCRIPASAFQPPPNFGTAVTREMIIGLASIDDELVILLDVNQLLGMDNASTGNGESQ